MTKKAFIESIMRILSGGNVRSSSNIHEKDVEASVSRAAAALLKMEAAAVNPMSGTSIPPYSLIATYEGVEVVNDGCDRSHAVLPATPITMPRQMGIWRVYSCDCGDIIPLEPGMMNVALGVTHTALSASLKKLACYEPSGNRVKFNKPKQEIGSTVDMQLLVMDILSLDDYSELPIPQDMEAKVVEMVKADLQPRPHDDSNDAKDNP